MKTKLFNLILFFPIILFSQNKYDANANFIKKNCNQKSLDSANKIYLELEKEQLDNSFDRTLIGYYHFLESTNCKKYNSILISAWEKDKVINSKSFRTFFLNSNENYKVFVRGLSLKKPFRFANINKFDQGIDDVLQNEMLKYLESKSKEDFRKVVRINIQKLEGQELLHFVSNLYNNFNLKLFESDLIDKSSNSKYPFDLHFLINKLFELQVEKPKIEKILNQKFDIWDNGNWSEKFWSMIKSNNLTIEKPKFYSLNSNASKNYEVIKFLETKQNNNELGQNPLLMIDWNFKNYKEGKLAETLNKLDIKQIDYTPKSRAVSLYGKSGIDGMLQIITK